MSRLPLTQTQRDEIVKALKPGESVWLGEGITARRVKRPYRMRDGKVNHFRYSYSFRLGNRTKSRGGFETYGKARAALADARAIERARYRGEQVEPVKMPFSRFADEYLEDKSSKRSIDDKRRIVARLVDHFGDRPLHTITRRDVKEYRDQRKRDKRGRTGRLVKPATVNNELRELSSMFSVAIDYEYVDHNPVLRIKVDDTEREIYAMSREVEDAMLQAAAPHLKPIIILGVETAMRTGEMLVLDWKRVDLEKRVVHVAETRTRRNKRWTVGPTKSGKVRTVPLSPRAVEALLSVYGRSGRVFTYRGKPIWDIKRAFERARRVAFADILERPLEIYDGYVRPRPHDMRSTAITRWVAADMNRFDIRDYAGHSSIKTTERYIAWAKDHSRFFEKMDALSAVGGQKSTRNVL